VLAAGRPEAFELLQAIVGTADHAVLLRQRTEVLRVAARESLDPRLARGLVVTAHRDEREMRGDAATHRAVRRGRADLLHALCVPFRRDHVRDPAVALAAGAGERGIGPSTDPDGRTRLLDGLRIDRHTVELREPSLERGRGVAPEGPD